jgi:N utilization substance protein A
MTGGIKKMNTELMEALTVLEKEKNISKDVMLDAIENSLMSACKNHFGTADNIKVIMNRETCDYSVIAEKEVVEEVMDPALEISLEDAEKLDSSLQIGDVAQIPVESKSFGRIATQNAKNLILQKIREEERKVIYDQFYEKEKDIVTGIVQRYVGKNISINLGRADAMLTESEQVRGETFKPTERIKLYIVEVKNTTKGPKIIVSRTHPELVKRLFEAEVTEIREGIVEIKSIAREAGSRTKMAVWSNDENVDPVGACVGMNGARVNAVVNELRGEKIDIINWDENPALLIENALSPAKVISVAADPDEKVASVIVPDYQLSLAIGKEGQNARLAARLTGYKIDIKSETQAIEAGELPEDYMEQMGIADEMDEDGFVGAIEQPYEEVPEDDFYDEDDDTDDMFADEDFDGNDDGGSVE